MKIALWRRIDGELVEVWRFEMGRDFMRKIDYDLRREEREFAKAQKRAQKQVKKAMKNIADEVQTDEMEIFMQNIENYDGTSKGQQDL